MKPAESGEPMAAVSHGRPGRPGLDPAADMVVYNAC
jgi:hypothetical protein